MKKMLFFLSLVISALFFSCDSSGDSTENDSTSPLTMMFKNVDGTPAINIEVNLTYEVDGINNTIDLGTTNSEGIVVASVPVNQTYVLKCYFETILLIDKNIFNGNSNNYLIIEVPIMS